MSQPKISHYASEWYRRERVRKIAARRARAEKRAEKPGGMPTRDDQRGAEAYMVYTSSSLFAARYKKETGKALPGSSRDRGNKRLQKKRDNFVMLSGIFAAWYGFDHTSFSLAS